MQPCFTPVVATGDLLFVSGQLAFGDDGSLVGDVAVQTRRCLANIEALLQPFGCGLGDIVKATVWLARVQDFAAFNAAYAACFPGAPPARSTLRADLMVAGALVEIEAIAVRR